MSTQSATWAAPLGRTLVNRPFETIASGPMDALAADVGPVATRVQAGEALLRAASGSEARAADWALREQLRLLQRLRAVRPGTRLLLSRHGLVGSGGKPILPDLARARQNQAVGQGSLTFVYENWSDADRAALEAFVQAIYPICVQIYGAPAFDLEVTVRRDDTLQYVGGGLYDASTNTIFIPGLTDFPEADRLAITRQILFAFHDDLAMFYDVWELGMVYAAADAALVIFDPVFDPSFVDSFYVHNLYELLNQPELAGQQIFDTGFDKMITWRIAMARAAWSKAYVEDPRFFPRFNAAYYPLAVSDPSLAGNVPLLSSLAAAALPTVEGQTFYEWFRQQYVLDTSFRLGEKLYVYNLPQQNSILMVVDHFSTGPDGQDLPLGGTVKLEFFDSTGQFSLFVQEGYEIPILDSGPSAGESGYSGSLFNIGGAQRITIEMVLGPVRRRLIFPYNVRGPDPGGSSLLGAVVGRDTGTIQVSLDGTGQSPIEVSQGSFGAIVGGGEMRPHKMLLEYDDRAGGLIRRQFNTGFFFYAVVPEIGSRQRLSHRFARPENGFVLFSVPGAPASGGEADLFGLPQDRLLLAYWDPRRSGDNKYVIYPQTPPIRPGLGFWMKLPTDIAVDFEADLLGVGQPLRRFLFPGWNLIGLPFETPLAKSALLFDVGATPVPFEQAVQNGWVRAVIFEYDPAEGYKEAEELEPWKGYWLRCIAANGVGLTFPSPVSAPAGVGRAGQPSAAADSRALGLGPIKARLEPGDWEIRVRAGGAAGTPSSATFGAARGATDGFDPLFDSEAPPLAPGQRVLVYCRRDGWSSGPVVYARDIRSATLDTYAFDFEVLSLDSGQQVTLTWSDLRYLPPSLTAVLSDLENGNHYFMRTTGACWFVAQAGVPRRFRIEVTQRRGPGLRIGGLIELPVRYGQKLMTFQLSQPAMVSFTLVNSSGRAVRKVVLSSAYGAGANTIPWQASDDRGRRLPSGTYMALLRAVSEDGEETTAMVPVVVE